MEYIHRIIDQVIDRRISAFNAVSIVGPKGCGKTRTAKERCNTVIEFQDETKRDGYLAVADTSPDLFLKNRKPILFDEWQDAPKIWGTIRKACDDSPAETGSYFQYLDRACYMLYYSYNSTCPVFCFPARLLARLSDSEDRHVEENGGICYAYQD